MSISEIYGNPIIAQIVIKALIVGVLVSLCSSLLGVSLVLKRLSMIGDGLSHVGFGALAVATVLDLGDYSMEVTIPIVIIAALVLLKLSGNRIKGDSAIAVFSTGAVAVGSLIFNYSGSRATDVCNSLFGSVSIITLTDKDLVMSIVLSVVVLAFFIIFYNRILAITFDETFAQATGIHTELYKMFLGVLTAVTVVVGMKMMGAIMISAIVVFPAISSMRLCKSFRSVIICSACISVICFLVGFFVGCRLSYQTGASVATANLIVFILFSFISWLSTRTVVRQAVHKTRLNFKKVIKKKDTQPC